MTHHKTKNTLIIDHDEKYIPILMNASGEMQLSANFSLGEQSTRSSERLAQLIDFIRNNMQSSVQSGHNNHSVGISHRLAAQIVYLAYWENYPLEFRMEGGRNVVVRAHFTRQPELTFTLDLFKNRVDPYREIQGWWDFLCELISSHAEIWHIPLAVSDDVYHMLIPGHYPMVQVDILPTIQEKG